MLTDAPDDLHRPLTDWYAAHARDLPWRHPDTTAWGVLVSEVMSQQTPVARVAPAWLRWMRRWPAPADLAAASTADVLRAWDRLGYPRRALRLRECAAAIVSRHDGEVPSDDEALLALPGIGPYTAAAVRAFAFSLPAVVLDTNVRRVFTRLFDGREHPPASVRRAERARAATLLPAEDSARWNVAVMELGALVCTARSPDCDRCPVSGRCLWLARGRPPDDVSRRTQAWTGTDRQMRGRIMQILKDLPGDQDLTAAELLVPLARHATDPEQPERALAALVDDGLVARVADARYRLPG